MCSTVFLNKKSNSLSTAWILILPGGLTLHHLRNTGRYFKLRTRFPRVLIVGQLQRLLNFANQDTLRLTLPNTVPAQCLTHTTLFQIDDYYKTKILIIFRSSVDSHQNLHQAPDTMVSKIQHLTNINTTANMAPVHHYNSTNSNATSNPHVCHINCSEEHNSALRLYPLTNLDNSTLHALQNPKSEDTSLSTPDAIGIIAGVLVLFGGLGWFAYHALVTLPRRKVEEQKDRRAKQVARGGRF